MTAASSQEASECPVGKPIQPILEEVETLENGMYLAHFGYENPNLQEINISRGNGNSFLYKDRKVEDFGQPEAFSPGRHYNVFSVEFDGTELIWNLDGNQTPASVIAE